MATGVYFDVTISDTDTFLELGTLRPVSDSLKWTYRLSDVGEIQCSFALSDPLLTTDMLSPKGSRFQLNMRVGQTGVPAEFWDSFPIMAGFCGPTNIQSETGLVSFTGTDWLSYLEQPYQWESETGGTGYAANIATYEASNASFYVNKSGQTVEQICQYLISRLDASFDPLAPVITPDFNGTSFFQTVPSWYWGFGDTETILDKFKELAKHDTGGFDFWMDYDGTLRCQGPRKTDPASVTPVYGIGTDQVVTPLDWTNNGPLATDTIGFGPGVGNTRTYSYSTYQPSRDQYGRWARAVDFDIENASLSNQTELDRLTASRGYLDRFPQKELRLPIRPDELDPIDPSAGFYNNVGNALTVDIDYGYHRINADFWITSQSFTSDSAGNWRMDCTLDQIYN